MRGVLAKKIKDKEGLQLIRQLSKTSEVMLGMLDTLLEINQLEAGIVRLDDDLRVRHRVLAGLLDVGDLDLERLGSGKCRHITHARDNRGRVRSAIAAKLQEYVAHLYPPAPVARDAAGAP